jgi:hypothetical protein
MSRFFSLISTLNRCSKDRRAQSLLVSLVIWFAGAAGLWYSLPYQPRFTLPGTEDCAVAGFSPNGKILATKLSKSIYGGLRFSGAENGAIRLWDIETGEELGNYSTKGRFAHHLEFSSDGRILVIGTSPLVGPGSLTIIDCNTKQELAEIGPVDSWQSHLTPDGKYLSFDPSEDGNFRIWDISAGREWAMPDFSPEWYSPDGQWFLSSDSEDEFKVRDFATGLVTASIKADRGSWHGWVISGDSKMIAGDGFTHVKLWEVATGRELVSLEKATNPKFSRDAKRLAVQYPEIGEPSFKLWSTCNGVELARFQVPGSGWNPASILAGPGSGDLCVAATREKGSGLPSLPDWMTRFLGIRVTYTTFHELKVFDIASGKELANHSTEQQIHLAPDARSFVLDSSGYLPPNRTAERIAVFDLPLRKPIASIVLWPLPFALVGMLIFWLFIIRRPRKVKADKSIEITG